MATLDDLRRILVTPDEYLQTFLRIRTKDARLVPLRLNTPQRKLYEIIHEQRNANQPVRIIVLKARQEGVSTLTEGLGFWLSATHKYTNGLVIAHDAEGSETLFQMCRRFYDNLPDAVKVGDDIARIKPEKRYSNRRELAFDDLDSSIVIDTAGNVSAGSGSTLQWVHASELAKWAGNPEETMTSLLQAVPDMPDTLVMLESTAKGVGGYFYNECQRAIRGESGFRFVFLAWFEMPEYTAPAPSDFILDDPAFWGSVENTVPGEERLLQERYHLTNEQLQWRRNTIRTKCQNDMDNFRQEYPTNPEEAFLTTGRPFFPAKKCQEKLHGCLPGTTGDIVNGNFVPSQEGYLTVWEPPQVREEYVIGSDVAEGLESGDYSVAWVKKRSSGQYVAKLKGHIDPDLWGVWCVDLAKWYGSAWLGIENNNHGLTSLKAAQRTNYQRLYLTRSQDSVTQKWTEKLGWTTSTTTRPLMLDHLKQVIRDDQMACYSSSFWQECLTFVRDEKGKPTAQSGCHDDEVMAAAITEQMHLSQPFMQPKPDPGPPKRKTLEDLAKEHKANLVKRNAKSGKYEF